MASRTQELWTVVIDRPLDDVFSYVARPGSEADWSPREYRAEDVSPGPVGVGTTWTAVIQVPPKNDYRHRNVEVVEYDEPNGFVLNVTDGDTLYIHTFTFSSMGSTATKVERVVDFPKPGGLAGAGFGAMMKTVVRPSIQKGMDLLKAQLESQ
jgi:hypothetical protein